MGYVLFIGLFALIVYEIVSTIKAIKKRKLAIKKRDEEHQEKLKSNSTSTIENVNEEKDKNNE